MVSFDFERIYILFKYFLFIVLLARNTNTNAHILTIMKIMLAQLTDSEYDAYCERARACVCLCVRVCFYMSLYLQFMQIQIYIICALTHSRTHNRQYSQMKQITELNKEKKRFLPTCFHLFCLILLISVIVAVVVPYFLCAFTLKIKKKKK